MRSWTYFIQLRGRNAKGEAKEEGALYIVAVPSDENLLGEVTYNCYARHYLPEESAVNYGKAYALGVDFEIENPEEYGINFYREDEELYIFKEGIPMKEGLKNVYRLLMKRLKDAGYGKDFDVIVDVGNPSEDLMRECLLEAIKSV
ncbi:MAG: hypothetical protein Q9N26_07155 [Aquificota bacterium]|nr:hypothetical protein [Aquificota bacterium]